MKFKKLTSVITSVLLISSMFGSTAIGAESSNVSSTESVSSENILQVNIDEDGSVQSGYKENPGTFHGGDLKGLTEKLNDGYFTDLGVNAIWITAPYEQIHGFTFGNTNNGQEGYGFPYYSYHGYWTLDYTNLDANMGTAADMEEFVDTAHSKGIRVVMDVVMNHLGYITAYDTNEYGIDGFRCDTAKHIPVSSWNELKTQAKVALKEWRENNPDKPGANWDEEFWMTGEDWGHEVYKDYYYSNGFDSMINFSFPKSGYTTSTLENIFSTYSSKINSDLSFNVLSYISSHDTDLGGRSDMIGAGNALLLTPGAAQIFYGDETNRQKQR